MEISDCRKKLNMNYDMSQIVAHRFKKLELALVFLLEPKMGCLWDWLWKKASNQHEITKEPELQSSH